MPGRIRIRPEVRGDLYDVVAYFEQQGRIGAEKVGSAFLKTVDELNLMPGLGSKKVFRSDRLRGVRSWGMKELPKILLFYRQNEDGIEVLGVFHGARDIKSLLMRRLRKR